MHGRKRFARSGERRVGCQHGNLARLVRRHHRAAAIHRDRAPQRGRRRASVQHDGRSVEFSDADPKHGARDGGDRRGRACARHLRVVAHRPDRKRSAGHRASFGGTGHPLALRHRRIVAQAVRSLAGPVPAHCDRQPSRPSVGHDGRRGPLHLRSHVADRGIIEGRLPVDDRHLRVRASSQGSARHAREMGCQVARARCARSDRISCGVQCQAPGDHRRVHRPQ